LWSFPDETGDPGVTIIEKEGNFLTSNRTMMNILGPITDVLLLIMYVFGDARVYRRRDRDYSYTSAKLINSRKEKEIYFLGTTSRT